MCITGHELKAVRVRASFCLSFESTQQCVLPVQQKEVKVLTVRFTLAASLVFFCGAPLRGSLGTALSFLENSEPEMISLDFF